MSALKMKGTVKLERPQGYVVAEKIKVGPDGNVASGHTMESTEGCNLFLNQGMCAYAPVIPSYGGSSYGPFFGGLFSRVVLSDNLDTVAASDTAVLGDTSDNYVTQEGAGTIEVVEPTVGDYYLKVTREITLFDRQSLPAGYTVNKVYAVVNDSANSAIKYVPELSAGSPVAAKLLSSPLTINDPDTEAVKVTYSIYFPLIGSPGINDETYGRVLVASGTITMQEKVLEDPAVAGGSVDWELHYAQRAMVGVADRIGAIATSTTIGKIGFINSPGQNPTFERTSKDNYPVVSRTQPTATSIRLQIEDALAHKPSPQSSDTAYALGVAWHRQGSGAEVFSPVQVRFPNGVDVDWNQSLEVHLQITFDWS